MADAKVNAQRIVIPRARLAFPDLFVPKSVDGGPLKYGATFLIAPDDPVIAKIRAEEERVAKEKWGAKAETNLAVIRANNRGAIKPGELKAQYDGFPGNFFISANIDSRPTVVNRDGTPLTAQDGKVYAGCYVLAHVQLWAQDNKFGTRINAEVTGVQFLEDGDAFSGGAAPSSTEDFANLDAGEGGEINPLD